MKIALILIAVVIVLIAFFAILPILTFVVSAFFKILLVIGIALGVGILVGKYLR